MIKGIHVVQKNLLSNKEHGTNLPCFTVKVYNSKDDNEFIKDVHAYKVNIEGPSEFIYNSEALKGSKL